MAVNMKGGAIARRLRKQVVDGIWASRDPAVARRLRKRVVDRIWGSRDPAAARRSRKRAVDRIWASRDPAVASRRAVHSSSYDKEVDDDEGRDVVPAVCMSGGDQYWAPNPRTGVFGPLTEEGVGSDSDPVPAAVNGSSVLDQKVWFHDQMEDVEKPYSLAP